MLPHVVAAYPVNVTVCVTVTDLFLYRRALPLSTERSFLEVGSVFGFFLFAEFVDEKCGEADDCEEGEEDDIELF